MDLRALVNNVIEPHNVRVLHLRQCAYLTMYRDRSLFLLQIFLVVSFDCDRCLRFAMNSSPYLSESALADSEPNLELSKVKWLFIAFLI